jgi:hypothetical protein
MRPTTAAFLCATLGATLLAACLDEGDDATIASDLAADTPEARVQLELARLAGVPLHGPPTPAEIDALIASGFPKPASPDPAVRARAKHAHETLMRWAGDALHRGLLAATSDDPAVVRGHAVALRQLLLAWVDHGTWFGDHTDSARYGNLTLELTWFLGDVARAAGILDALAAEPGSGATGVWSAADHARFLAWANALVDRYVDFDVFASGLSNRRASQIETLLRVAELEPDATRRRAALLALHGRLRALLEQAVRADGVIPEDTCRDKYHEQFFLASALQARELLLAHGLPLDAQRDATAVARLLAATSASATRNMSAGKPAACASMDDAAPNHGIPLWALAPGLFAAYGRALPADVATMLARQYARGGFGLVIQWGYNATSLAYGLGGNVRATRLRGVVEAEAFVAASPGTDVVAAPGAGGGRVIAQVAAGEAWDYGYPVAAGGTRPVKLLVAAPQGATLELAIVGAGGKAYRKAIVQAPATGSLDAFRWVAADVHEPNAGDKILRVRALTGGLALDALRLAP